MVLGGIVGRGKAALDAAKRVAEGQAPAALLDCTSGAQLHAPRTQRIGQVEVQAERVIGRCQPRARPQIRMLPSRRAARNSKLRHLIATRAEQVERGGRKAVGGEVAIRRGDASLGHARARGIVHISRVVLRCAAVNQAQTPLGVVGILVGRVSCGVACGVVAETARIGAGGHQCCARRVDLRCGLAERGQLVKGIIGRRGRGCATAAVGLEALLSAVAVDVVAPAAGVAVVKAGAGRAVGEAVQGVVVEAPVAHDRVLITKKVAEFSLVAIRSR